MIVHQYHNNILHTLYSAICGNVDDAFIRAHQASSVDKPLQSAQSPLGLFRLFSQKRQHIRYAMVS